MADHEPNKGKVVDHPFKPCFHPIWIAEAIFGLCQSPYGPRRCHVKGCGKLESEHVESIAKLKQVETS